MPLEGAFQFQSLAKMFKLKSFQYFFTVLYVLGLNPFVSFENPSLRRGFIATYMPRLLSICVYLIIASGFLIHMLTSSGFLTSRTVLVIFDISNLIGHFENIQFNSKYPRVILQTVYSTINYLEMHFQIQYPLNKLHRKFQLKYLMVLALHLGTVLIKYAIRSPFGTSVILDLFMTTSSLLKDFQVFHIMFYIDFMKFSLQSLSRKIIKFKGEKIECSTLNDQESLHMLRQVKLVHFKLWNVSFYVNLQFGWFFVVYLLETVMSATNSIYWVFLYVVSGGDNFIYISRK